MNSGFWYAVGAYVLWGVFPLYWKALQEVPAPQILAHRMAWSVLVVALLLGFQGGWRWIRAALSDGKILLTFFVTGSMLAVNWFLYIWAVNSERVVEASLGYFINPLVNVVLGWLFLGETLRRGQRWAVGLAAGGVAYLTFGYGHPPWIALVLAVTFGLYGLLRKTASLGSLRGFALETMLFFPFAAGYLMWVEAQGTGAFGHSGLKLDLLMALAGVATAAPLLLFASGARRLSLSTLGLLQYIAPTLQFLLGVLVYGEQVGPDRLIAFVLIWGALALYSAEGLLHARSVKAPIGPKAALNPRGGTKPKSVK